MKTKIIKINNNNAIKYAVNILKNGGLFIYPTETCYGIGADATNDDAVKKVFEIKQRPPNKYITVAFSDVDMIKKYIKISKNSEKLIKKFMPGPLTLVDNGVGFRIPKHKIILEIIKKFGKPITTTSANISGQRPLYKISDIIKTFSERVELILDAGDLKEIPPSTVFDVKKRKIIRNGPIKKREIIKVLNTFTL
ncbi:MAG: L-threonylcarbamoyladenylate synthase [Candidatus Aenigmatarchaeota archaeon]